MDAIETSRAEVAAEIYAANKTAKALAPGQPRFRVRTGREPTKKRTDYEAEDFPHGTTGYRYGCRCELCGLENAVYRNDWRKRKGLHKGGAREDYWRDWTQNQKKEDPDAA